MKSQGFLKGDKVTTQPRHQWTTCPSTGGQIWFLCIKRCNAKKKICRHSFYKLHHPIRIYSLFMIPNVVHLSGWWKPIWKQVMVSKIGISSSRCPFEIPNANFWGCSFSTPPPRNFLLPKPWTLKTIYNKITVSHWYRVDLFKKTETWKKKHVKNGGNRWKSI